MTTRALSRTAPAGRFDLLKVPVVGRFLGWKHARTAMQATMLLLAGVILFDGFFGPQLAPRNVAGVVPWVHWRGFVVLALLVAGNLFCMACPFMLPRRLAKRLLPADRTWPRRIPGKWVAVAMLLLFFWAYEAFDLWASPWLTAWVVVAYFAVAFVVDGFFKGAAFCKHVCPIGQFHFVNGMVSPLEVGVRDASACASCITKDCIAGRHDLTTGKTIQNGCELYLFQERKYGNMDCTFCLDCVQACPYDNVGILARNPISEFASDPNRSGLGRLGERLDIAALALVLVFGAFVNAFGMVTPVYDFQNWLARTFGLSSEYSVLAVIFGAGLIVLPLVLVGAAAWLSRVISKTRQPVSRIATRFSLGLIPLGFGMWLGHYSFHFLTGAFTIIPVMQSFLSDLGVPGIGDPRWDLAGVLPVSVIDWLVLITLELGLLVTLYALYRVSLDLSPNRRVARMAALPWFVLAIALCIAGAWVMTQPMEMRGTMLAG